MIKLIRFFIALFVTAFAIAIIVSIPITVGSAIEYVFTKYLLKIFIGAVIIILVCFVVGCFRNNKNNSKTQSAKNVNAKHEKESVSNISNTKKNGNQKKNDKQKRNYESQAKQNIQRKCKKDSETSDIEDPLLLEAISIVVGSSQATTSLLQRRLNIGYARAERVMKQMEDRGIVGSSYGSKPRRVLISKEDWLEIQLRRGDELFCDEFVPETGILTDCKNHPELDEIGERIKLYNNKFDYMDGRDFEYFCADLLRKNGFDKVEVTKGSGDQGIDIIAFKDGIKYGIQCKCYANDIGNSAVQEAFSGRSFYRCHVAAVLTNRYFTSSAKELAENNGVLLWDRDRLNQLCEVLEH